MMKRRSIINAEDGLNITESQLFQLLNQLRSCNENEKLVLIKKLRQLLSQETNPPLEFVIQHGIVDICISILDHGNDLLIMECLWCIINLSCVESNQIDAIMTFVPYLCHFLRLNKNIFREQSLWILGNIAAENNDKYRNELIHMGIIPQIILILRTLPIPSTSISNSLSKNENSTSEAPLVSIGFWTLYNLLRGKVDPTPFINEGILSLCEKFIHYPSKDIQADVMWVLAGLTSKNDDVCNYIITSPIYHYIYTSIHKLNEDDLLPMLKVIGNICAGDNDFIYKLISNENICLTLYTCLLNRESILCKETLWILSNIFLSNDHSIHILINNKYIPVLYSLLNKGTWEQRKETLICFCNLCLAHSNFYSKFLFHSLLIRGCLDFLFCTDYLTMSYALKLLLYVIYHCNSSFYNLFLEQINVIENLSCNPSIPMNVRSMIIELHKAILTIEDQRTDEFNLEESDIKEDHNEYDVDMEIPDFIDHFQPPSSIQKPSIQSKNTLFQYMTKDDFSNTNVKL